MPKGTDLLKTVARTQLEQASRELDGFIFSTGPRVINTPGEYGVLFGKNLAEDFIVHLNSLTVSFGLNPANPTVGPVLINIFKNIDEENSDIALDMINADVRSNKHFERDIIPTERGVAYTSEKVDSIVGGMVHIPFYLNFPSLMPVIYPLGEVVPFDSNVAVSVQVDGLGNDLMVILTLEGFFRKPPA